MQGELLKDEVRDVVWSCDNDRASGFDGFTFQIPKKIFGSSERWVLLFVEEFYHLIGISWWCNSSFFTLIPKVDNPILIKDDIPISLIGIHNNFIVKLLANRLAKVV